MHSRVLPLFNLGPDVTMDSRNDGAFTHDMADVNMIALMVKLHNLVRSRAVMILITLRCKHTGSEKCNCIVVCRRSAGMERLWTSTRPLPNWILRGFSFS